MAYPTFPAPADVRNDGHRRVRSTALAGLALLLATPAVAAPNWSAPIQSVATGHSPLAIWHRPQLVSGSLEDRSGAIALDDAGNASSVCNSINNSGAYPVEASILPASGAWKAPVELQVQADPYLDYRPPIVRSTATGEMTAVWTNAKGIWASEKRPGQVWSAPIQIGPGLSGGSRYEVVRMVFAMNRSGAAVVAWSDARNSHTYPLYAVTRPAGGSWSAYQIVVPANFGLVADSVAVGANGAMIIAWERNLTNGVALYASRAVAPGASWVTSPQILPPQNGYFKASVAVDAAGDAGIVAVVSEGIGRIVALNQPGAGAPWSSPVRIVAGDYELLTPVLSDDAGNATVLTLPVNDLSLLAIEGSIVTNHWSAKLPIVAARYGTGISALAVAANGKAVVCTSIANDASGYTSSIAALTRSSPAGSWTAAVPLSGASPYNYVTDVATNPAGQAVCTWIKELNQAPTTSLYANTFR